MGQFKFGCVNVHRMFGSSSQFRFSYLESEIFGSRRLAVSISFFNIQILFKDMAKLVGFKKESLVQIIPNFLRYIKNEKII